MGGDGAVHVGQHVADLRAAGVRIGAKGDFGFFPDRIEGCQVGRVVVRLGQHLGDSHGVGLCACKLGKRGERGGISAFTPDKPCIERVKDMHRVGQGILCLERGTRRQELKQHRQVIRKFRGGRLEPASPVGLDQADHCAAPVTAFAVHMFEQVQ